MLSLTNETDLLRGTAAAVRLRRQALNLRQTDLAERSGVAVATLRRFERSGQITFAGLAKLLVACGLAEPVLRTLEAKSTATTTATISEFLAESPKRQRVRRRNG